MKREEKIITEELLKEIDIPEDLCDLLTYGDELEVSEFEDFMRLIIVFIEPEFKLKVIKLAKALDIKNLPAGVLAEFTT